MDSYPNISIILPVFNGEKFLEEAIVSCLSQTYGNFELLIIDDCSTDSSIKIAEKYERLDDRIRIINNSLNLKLPASLNIGHKLAEGNFLLWTSDDNRLKPIFLEKILNTIVEKKVDIAYCNYDIIYESGTLKREHQTGPISHLIFGNTVGSAFIYNKNVFQKLEGYDENLHTIEDYDFWIRAAVNFKFFHLDENLYEYRIHEQSLTSKTLQNEHGLVNLNGKVNEVFKKLQFLLHWQPETTIFLTNLPKNEIFNFFKANNRTILADVKKFKSRVSENMDAESTDKLYFLLRQNLKSTGAKLDVQLLLWILLNHPKIFFQKNFSRKETLKLIFRFI